MGDQMGDELFDYARSESGLSVLGSASSPPGLTLLGYTPLLWGWVGELQEVIDMSDERFTVSSPKAIEGLIEAWRRPW